MTTIKFEIMIIYVRDGGKGNRRGTQEHSKVLAKYCFLIYLVSIFEFISLLFFKPFRLLECMILSQLNKSMMSKGSGDACTSGSWTVKGRREAGDSCRKMWETLQEVNVKMSLRSWEHLSIACGEIRRETSSILARGTKENTALLGLWYDIIHVLLVTVLNFFTYIWGQLSEIAEAEEWP